MNTIISKKNTEADFQARLTDYMQDLEYSMMEYEDSSAINQNIFAIKNYFNKAMVSFYTRLPGYLFLSGVAGIITYSLMSV